MERLVDNTSVGNIQGQVSNTLVPTGCTPAVYLYAGTVSAPEDMNSLAPAGDANQPLLSKVPVPDSQPPYYLQFTFLQPGSYTVAFTCQAAVDNPDQADPAVKFNPIESDIVVTAGHDHGRHLVTPQPYERSGLLLALSRAKPRTPT